MLYALCSKNVKGQQTTDSCNHSVSAGLTELGYCHFAQRHTWTRYASVFCCPPTGPLLTNTVLPRLRTHKSCCCDEPAGERGQREVVWGWYFLVRGPEGCLGLESSRYFFTSAYCSSLTLRGLYSYYYKCLIILCPIELGKHAFKGTERR